MFALVLARLAVVFALVPARLAVVSVRGVRMSLPVGEGHGDVAPLGGTLDLIPQEPLGEAGTSLGHELSMEFALSYQTDSNRE